MRSICREFLGRSRVVTSFYLSDVVLFYSTKLTSSLNTALPSRNMNAKQLVEKDNTLLKDIFDLYDTTGEARITVSCLGQCLRAAGLNPTQAEVRKVERNFGKDTMVFEEFVPIYHSIAQHCTSTEKKVSSDAVIDCFKHFDRTESGVISSSMLRHVLTSLGEKMTDEEIDALIAGHVNNRGEIDYETMVKEILMVENS